MEITKKNKDKQSKTSSGRTTKSLEATSEKGKKSNSSSGASKR
jgi:hypothetical protein